MNKPRAKASLPKVNLALIIIAAVVIVAGALLGLSVWTRHEQAVTKTSLAKGYATQPLGAPFKLEASWWLPGIGPFASSGMWDYVYTADLDQSATVAAAKAQLGRGAYQVDANHADVITTTNATLYRDLITEDVALKVVIGTSDDTARPVSAPSSPTGVTVILSPLAGQ